VQRITRRLDKLSKKHGNDAAMLADWLLFSVGDMELLMRVWEIEIPAVALRRLISGEEMRLLEKMFWEIHDQTRTVTVVYQRIEDV